MGFFSHSPKIGFHFLVLPRKIETQIISLHVFETFDKQEEGFHHRIRPSRVEFSLRIPQQNWFAKIPLCIKDFFMTDN